ncbi:MAG TPA: hypothetical protein VMH30_06880 [Verrucomicrobiae bacterium]|nr:hypothetical protein [Verrucomicrobiae bacterium]
MTVSLFTGRAIRGWSCGLVAAWALQLTAQADQIIYDDALGHFSPRLQVKYARFYSLLKHNPPLLTHYPF